MTSAIVPSIFHFTIILKDVKHQKVSLWNTMQDFQQAQLQSIQLLADFKERLQVGMNVQQGQLLLQELNQSHGFLGWLTRPTLLFQAQKNSFIPTKQVLREGSIVVIHLQPLTSNAYGSIGESFCFQHER